MSLLSSKLRDLLAPSIKITDKKDSIQLQKMKKLVIRDIARFIVSTNPQWPWRFLNRPVLFQAIASFQQH